MAWIESHQSLSRHRKTIRASGLLQVDRHKLIGHLHELWWWGLDNVGVDGRLGDMTPGEVAMAAEWDGDEEVFVNALVEAGFLDREDGGLYLHNWKGPGVNAVDVEVMRRKWEAMSPRVRPQILNRDNYTCQACGETEGPLEIDHIVPIARGGTNKPSNLQVLCRPCNRRKGTDIWPG